MLHTRFHAPAPSGSEEDFEYFSLCFYGSNQVPPGVGPFWILRSSFEQTWY